EASGGRPHRASIERLDERHGWEELGVRVAEVARGMRADAPDRGVFLLGSSYGVAATLAFYLPTGEEVHLWSPRRKHGENYRFWERFDELGGQDAIYVAKRLQQVEEALPELREHFAEVAPAEELTIVRDGRAVRSFLLVRCRRFDGARPY
ncbi:MAG TPA: hypothetical protein VJP77_03245, partial [Planctomycetota bacterium]|nr:hypothetical protein [Planctomycetota bacterium]